MDRPALSSTGGSTPENCSILEVPTSVSRQDKRCAPAFASFCLFNRATTQSRLVDPRGGGGGISDFSVQRKCSARDLVVHWKDGTDVGIREVGGGSDETSIKREFRFSAVKRAHFERARIRTDLCFAGIRVFIYIFIYNTIYIYI